MNIKSGFYSAMAVTITTFLFAVGMIIGNDTASYFVCMLLSWGYILLTCSFAVEVTHERKALAYGGMAFACLYGVFINLVYFTQLTTVANKTASTEVLKILSYQSLGSLMFNLDLFGYGMMAISTLLIGIAINPKNKSDKWLKALLMIHGMFTPACVIMPMLNIFNSHMGASGDFIGIIVLLIWCIYFIPIGILSTVHFKKNNVNL
ncbi:putative membrane protein [Clostridium sporogenes]|uniref:hypothetical protein n=1 Tax=Clostridium TaxID=1485 RepID=UPI0005F8CB10|nr:MULTISPECIES: hypothetical protein [Clostridium]APF27781.1 putative membrane protein [Clostridium sporogenes]MDI6918487.1 hypothetical protein [Clostridium botulinum]WMU96434.1 hypothetical protein QA656_11700 [Clostridium botulinum]